MTNIAVFAEAHSKQSEQRLLGSVRQCIATSLTVLPAVIRACEAVCHAAARGHGGRVVTADIVKGAQLASLIPAPWKDAETLALQSKLSS